MVSTSIVPFCLRGRNPPPTIHKTGGRIILWVSVDTPKQRKFSFPARMDPRIRGHPACSVVNIPYETTNLSTNFLLYHCIISNGKMAVTEVKLCLLWDIQFPRGGKKKQCRIWFYNSGDAQMHLQNRIVFSDLVNVASCKEGSFGNIQLSAGTNHFAHLQPRNFESCKTRTVYNTWLQLVFQVLIGWKGKAI